jgi:sugar lactone lactonase YvrE
MVTDSRGALYITDVTHNGIVKYEPRTKSMSLIASDDGVHWPDTPALLPNGDLVFTSSALSDHVAGLVASGHERYELWRMSIGGK